MPTTDRELCHDAIRTALAQRAGDLSDAGRIARATSDTWNRMAAQLVPVIGTLGVEALFKRSVRLTGGACPWMTPLGEETDGASLPARVTTLLAGREPDTAAQAGYSLLTTFTEQLAILIGHSLTKRLLAPAWASTPPEAGQETTP
ncbi:hypothetical protein DSECCO2_636900 [anaerobic digester metagenome]